MCGFAGFLQQSAVVEAGAMEAMAGRMATTLQHRGPDDSGTWCDERFGIALGHRRLSIIDLSREGHQPMISGSGRYVIAFNGEIYNFEALRGELPGVRWKGHSDTEVMLAAFERWGLEGALRRFNGMFAFALWDRTERTLHLARDRLGEKPVYFGWVGASFLFGSELKALRVHPAWRGTIDRGAVASFLRNNYVPAPHSIYAGIGKLQPGHYVSITSAAAEMPPKPQPFWSLRAVTEEGEARPLHSETIATDELDILLRDAVRMRMVADVPVGIFLSGGIDSSVVLALAQIQSARPVRSFSIGFEEAAYNEAHHAKAVAKHLGADHTELYVTPQQAMSVIPRLPAIYDEPFSDPSQIPTILLSRLAREHVTVALAGDGGDELFCGYDRYFWARAIWGKVGAFPHGVRKLAGRALTTMSPRSWDRVLTRLAPLLRSAQFGRLTGDRLHKLATVLDVPSPDVLYESLVTHWNEGERLVPGAPELLSVVTEPAAWAAVRDFTSRMMYCDTAAYLPDDLLVKVDRASMSEGLEVRVPLLDHRVVEFASRAPLSMKIRDEQGKWLLRQVLHRYVPRKLVDRPKMGFSIPLDTWLRGPLRDWAEELLNERRLRDEGYIDPAPIRRKWLEHLSGRRRWQDWLWDVLMFQAWLEEERRPLSQAAVR